jgi:hypothetical protein
VGPTCEPPTSELEDMMLGEEDSGGHKIGEAGVGGSSSAESVEEEKTSDGMRESIDQVDDGDDDQVDREEDDEDEDDDDGEDGEEDDGDDDVFLRSDIESMPLSCSFYKTFQIEFINNNHTQMCFFAHVLQLR